MPLRTVAQLEEELRMVTILALFSATGVVLLALALVGLRWHGEKAPVFKTVGRFLVGLAFITALFPAVLERLGPAVWAAAYIGFVVIFTVVMTVTAVAQARALKS